MHLELRAPARRVYAIARRLPSMVSVPALLLALAIVAANLGVWQLLNPPIEAPDFHGRVTGMAYNAFQRWDDPTKRRYPSVEDVENDLAMLADHTRRIRTYSSSEIPELPAIAARYGLKVTAGV